MSNEKWKQRKAVLYTFQVMPNGRTKRSKMIQTGKQHEVAQEHFYDFS
jgi:hypothetical protein